jgi:hypothetical protein
MTTPVLAGTPEDSRAAQAPGPPATPTQPFSHAPEGRRIRPAGAHEGWDGCRVRGLTPQATCGTPSGCVPTITRTDVLAGQTTTDVFFCGQHTARLSYLPQLTVQVRLVPLRPCDPESFLAVARGALQGYCPNIMLQISPRIDLNPGRQDQPNATLAPFSPSTMPIAQPSPGVACVICGLLKTTRYDPLA